MRGGLDAGPYGAAERAILARHPEEGALHFAPGWDGARLRRAAEAIARTDGVLSGHASRRLTILLEPAVPSMQADDGPAARKAGSATAHWPDTDEIPASPEAARLLRRLVEQSGLFGYVGLPSLMAGGRATIRALTVQIRLAPAASASARAAQPGAWAALAAEDRAIASALRSDGR